MAETTVELVLEQATRLSPGDRQRLVRLLSGTGHREGDGAARIDGDPFADGPQMARWREAMRRAEGALGLHSTEEIMSHLRRRPWSSEA